MIKIKYLLFTLIALIFVSCTNITPIPSCDPNDKECNEIVAYCSPLTDKERCLKQLMYQMEEKRKAPKCDPADTESQKAVAQCGTALYPGICSLDIGKCTLEPKENFQECSQKVLCFQGSQGCLTTESSNNSAEDQIVDYHQEFGVFNNGAE